MHTRESLKQQIIAAGNLLAAKGFVAGSDGNISARRKTDEILITPSGANKGSLTPAGLVRVDLTGRVLSGQNRPSSETAMHLFVYRLRPEIGACVHSHPPFATALAVAGIPLPPDILPEVVLFVGEVPLTDFAPPGTEAVPQSLAPYIEKADAFLLRNHGLLTVGTTVSEALNRHETVEHAARIFYLAHQLGRVNRLPADEITRLEQMRQEQSAATAQRDSD